MCTVITLEQKDKPSFATKDIKVYKIGKFISFLKFLSVYLDHEYITEYLYKNKIKYNKDAYLVSDTIELHYRNSIPFGQAVFITKGFHSFATLKRLKESDKLLSSNEIGLFIIPKGSLYYKNGCNNIVSNQIIFKHFI